MTRTSLLDSSRFSETASDRSAPATGAPSGRSADLQRRRVLRLLTGGTLAPLALAPVARALADQEIDIPDDPRQIVPSPAPPWEAGVTASDSMDSPSDWPEPVVRVNSVDDIALASAVINTAGQGTWIWGPGTFSIPAVTSTHTALYFSNLTEFRMVGSGAARTILTQDVPLADATEQLRLMAFENIGKLNVKGFAFDGKRSRYDLPDSPSTGENSYWQGIGDPMYRLHNSREAMNNIFMRNVGEGSLREIHNISSRGDFVNLANVSNLLIHDCEIADCGRNGITLGGVRGLEWSRNVEISHCRFRGDIDTQMIDLELHGDEMATPAQFNRNLYIHDCLFEAQSPDDSIDKDQFAIVLYAVMDFRVERCEIHGPVIVRNGQGVLRDNTGGISQFTMDRFSAVDIERTRFELIPQLRKANRNVCGILVARRDDTSPLRFTLHDCDIESAGLDSVMEVHDCPEVDVIDNRFSSSNGPSGFTLIAREIDTRARIAGNAGLGEPGIREANGRRILVNQS